MPPAMSDSRIASMSSCRTTCQRLAPIATRTLTSLERCAARDRSKFATFALAIASLVVCVNLVADGLREVYER